jgi:hypothetical protein
MDWLLDWCSNHPMLALIVGFVLFIALAVWYSIAEADDLKRLREPHVVRPDRFPSEYTSDLKSEVLLTLYFVDPRILSIRELVLCLPHIKATESQFWETLKRDLIGRVEGMISSEAPVGAPGSVEVYKLTELGKESIIDEGITPVYSETARREFYRVRESLFTTADRDLEPLTKGNKVLRRPCHEICGMVFEHFAKIKDGFLDSYVSSLAATSATASPIRRTWLAYQLRQCWSHEFMRARNYAIDLCIYRASDKRRLRNAISQFDNRAASLEDSVWNDGILLLLRGGGLQSRQFPAPQVPQNELAQIRDIVAGLQEFAGGSPQDRRVLLEMAGLSRFIPVLNLDGPPAMVASTVVSKLAEFGNLPEKPDYDALAALIAYLLRSMQDLPVHKQKVLAEIVVKYCLVRDVKYTRELTSTYRLGDDPPPLLG